MKNLILSTIILIISFSAYSQEYAQVQNLGGYDIYFMSVPTGEYTTHFEFSVKELINEEGSSFREQLEIAIHKIANESMVRNVNIDAIVFDEKGFGEAISYTEKQNSQGEVYSTYGIRVFALSTPISQLESNGLCYPAENVPFNPALIQKHLKTVYKYSKRKNIKLQALIIDKNGLAEFATLTEKAMPHSMAKY